MRFRLVVDGEAHEIEVVRNSKGTHVRVDGAEYRVQSRRGQDGFLVRIGRTAHRVRLHGERVVVDDANHRISVQEIEAPVAGTMTRTTHVPSLIEIRPPMPGRVIRVGVTSGARVKKGQTLAVLEAMKMQNEIAAPGNGTVRAIQVTEGEVIPASRVIAVLELD